VASNKEHRLDPEFVKRQNALRRVVLRKRRYGLSAAEYAARIEAQGGVICRRVPAKSFHVDHDHRTKGLRALLCSQCNTGLGMFGENPGRLREAAAYLERYSKC
jgi:hypothetical protein